MRLEGAVCRVKDIHYFNVENLMRTMQDVYNNTKRPFILIVDEWDCIFREYKHDREAQSKYLDFLRDLLKDKGYIYLTYMTGILPIKKYGTHSALNMFSEFSMINPRQLARYVGFTEEEVCSLCEKYKMSLDEMKEWYDGYRFEEMPSVYSPRSVVEAVTSGICDNYWNQTETFEALRIYIDMNFEGLKDDVLSMMAGERVPVNTGNFSNDMVTFHSKDDVLTLLVHLGYLGYDFDSKCVFIPNNEIRNEYVNAVSVSQWGEVSKALKNSADTLYAIWNHREKQVAEGIIFPDKPALVVELKWDKSAEGAIAQIKNKEYCKSLEEYQGNLLLVGIDYKKDTKEHTCIIEEYQK